MSILTRTYTPSRGRCLPHAPLQFHIRALGSSRRVNGVNAAKLPLRSQKEIHLSSAIDLEEIQEPNESRVVDLEKKKMRVWPALALGLAALLFGLGLFAPTAAMASTGEKLATSFRGKLPDWLVVLCISAFPIVELRGAIPVSIAVLGYDPLRVLPLAIVGNMIPVPFILLFLGPFSKALSRFPFFKRLFDKVFERSRNQGAAWKKNEFMALTLFVGLPLPGTGAWSGAIGAFVLGMPFAKAFLANLIGVCMAGTIVTSLTLMGWKGLALALVIFVGIPILAMLRGEKNEARGASD